MSRKPYIPPDGPPPYPCAKCYSKAVCDRGESACGGWWRWFEYQWPVVTLPFYKLLEKEATP